MLKSKVSVHVGSLHDFLSTVSYGFRNLYMYAHLYCVSMVSHGRLIESYYK
jgi:hypothetical protein